MLFEKIQKTTIFLHADKTTVQRQIATQGKTNIHLNVCSTKLNFASKIQRLDLDFGLDDNAPSS